MSKTEVMYSISKITGVVKKNKLTLIGVLVGLAGGFLYWKFIGCASGSCPITSSPFAISMWGAAMGGFLFSAFEKKGKMRKITTILLLAGLLLTSCGGQTKKNNNQDKENTMTTIHLTKADFLSKVANYEASPSEWKYLGDRPAIIDFYASWCGPCKMIAPILEELAAEYGDSIYIYKIDTEKEQELASAFGIRSIPTLLFVPMEGAPQQAQGAMPKEALKEAIDAVLLNKQQ